MVKTIGKLERLRRYPVKSMAGEELSAIFVQAPPYGVVGDGLFGLPFYASEEAISPE